MKPRKPLFVVASVLLTVLPSAVTRLFAAAPTTMDWMPFGMVGEPASAPKPHKLTQIAILAAPAEPGERMIITGTIYKSDGRTPVADAVMYAYQTDATGVYAPGTNSSRNPRLKGHLKTGADGKYEIRTIKPGSYPGSRNPAHIHANVTPPGGKEQWIDEFLFDGDPFLKDEDYRKFSGRGSFSSIIKLEQGKDGILRGTRDIRIEAR